MSQTISRQITSKKEAKKLKATKESATSLIGVSFLILSFFFYGFLTILLDLAVHMSDHMHNLLVNVPRGATSNFLFTICLQLAKFDFFPTEKADPIFGELEETN
jgi:amino acid transporter